MSERYLIDSTTIEPEVLLALPTELQERAAGYIPIESWRKRYFGSEDVRVRILPDRLLVTRPRRAP